MAKVTQPLGSISAHGTVGKAIVFQGDVARVHVTPKDAKKEVQVEVRSEFREISKLLTFAGPWARTVFYQAFGPRWFTKLYGWIKGNSLGYDQLARNKYDSFSAGDQLEWDAVCPYLTGMPGMGRQFYRTIDMCYWQLYNMGTGLWQLNHYQDGDYNEALDWWLKDGSIYFEPGVYDDNDLRIGYSAYMGTHVDALAFGGTFHVGNVDYLTNCNFYFLGRRVKLRYVAYPEGATAKITIDGDDSYLAQADPSEPYGHVWESGLLTQGAHHVEMRQNGVGYMTLDGVEIE